MGSGRAPIILSVLSLKMEYVVVRHCVILIFSKIGFCFGCRFRSMYLVGTEKLAQKMFHRSLIGTEKICFCDKLQPWRAQG